MSTLLQAARVNPRCARTPEMAKARALATTTTTSARAMGMPLHRRSSLPSPTRPISASNPLLLSRRRGPAAPAGVRTWLRNTISDFNRKSRQRTLDAFYNASSAEEQVALLSDDFALHEDGSPNSFGKEQYEETMKAAYASVPDWNWTHATDALVDAEGYAIVTLQATGHFTGAPYRAVAHPEWPSLTPTGKRFALAPETVKVKVNKRGKIEEIAIVPVPGGGPRGLYEALGGKMPPSK